jgi:hypothetical protein
MNKYQQALNNCVNRWAPTADWNLLKTLVEKATPKKPIQKAAGRMVCPNCERSIAREVSPRYCCVCGQRLDWSEE